MNPITSVSVAAQAYRSETNQAGKGLGAGESGDRPVLAWSTPTPVLNTSAAGNPLLPLDREPTCDPIHDYSILGVRSLCGLEITFRYPGTGVVQGEHEPGARGGTGIRKPPNRYPESQHPSNFSLRPFCIRETINLREFFQLTTHPALFLSPRSRIAGPSTARRAATDPAR